VIHETVTFDAILLLQRKSVFKDCCFDSLLEKEVGWYSRMPKAVEYSSPMLHLSYWAYRECKSRERWWKIKWR